MSGKMRNTTALKVLGFTLALLALAVFGCQKLEKTQAKPTDILTELPVVLVDADHMQVKHADGKTPLVYDIPAGDGLILDATNYEFRAPKGQKDTPPQKIQLIVDKQGYYTNWLPGETIYTLSSKTLIPLPQALPFKGLAAGTQVILAIGYVVESGGQRTFKPQWGAIANVH